MSDMTGTPTPAPKEGKSRSWLLIVIVLVVVCCLAAVCAGVILYTNGDRLSGLFGLSALLRGLVAV